MSAHTNNSPTMQVSIDQPGTSVTSFDEGRENLDNAIETQLQVARLTKEEFVCPQSNCDYSGTLAQLRGHISVHDEWENTTRHSFERYVITCCERACNADLEQTTIDDAHDHSNDDETDSEEPQYECPAEQCSYTNTIPSLAAHINGTHNRRHDREELGINTRTRTWIRWNLDPVDDDDDDDAMNFDITLGWMTLD